MKTNTKRSRIRDERGQTMAEFAIVLPILIVLLFGIVQFGILFNNYVTLTDAVRAGAPKTMTPSWRTASIPASGWSPSAGRSSHA